MFTICPISDQSRAINIPEETALDMPLVLAPALVVRQVGVEWLVISKTSGGWCYLTPKEWDIARALNGQRIQEYADTNQMDSALLGKFVNHLVQRQIFILSRGTQSMQSRLIGGASKQSSRFILTLLLSNHCILACEYCYHAMSDHVDKSNMSREIGIKALQYAYQQNTDELMIDFGEISVNERVFRQLFDDAKTLQEQTSKPTIFAIQTNGTTLSHKKAVYYKQNGFFVGLSLDGPESIHDLMRKFPRGSGSYKNTRAGLDHLIELEISFIVNATIHRHNFQNAREILSHFNDIHIAHFAFKPILRRGSAVSAWDKDGLSPSEYYEFLDEMVVQALEHYNLDWLDTTFITLLQRALGDMRGWASLCYSGYCQGSNAQLVVNADGFCYPCPRFSSIGKGEYSLGTLETCSGKNKISATVDLKFRKKSSEFDHKCKDCAWSVFCGGGCPVVGETSDVGNDMCLFTSKMYELIFETIFPQLRSGKFGRSNRLGELHFFQEDFFVN